MANLHTDGKAVLDRQQQGLAKALVAARERNGVSIEWARQEAECNHATLWSLEGNGPTCQSGPRVQLGTAISLIKLYYPSVTLEHFLPDTDMKVMFKDHKARERWRRIENKRYAGTWDRKLPPRRSRW